MQTANQNPDPNLLDDEGEKKQPSYFWTWVFIGIIALLVIFGIIFLTGQDEEVQEPQTEIAPQTPKPEALPESEVAPLEETPTTPEETEEEETPEEVEEGLTGTLIFDKDAKTVKVRESVYGKHQSEVDSRVPKGWTVDQTPR